MKKIMIIALAVMTFCFGSMAHAYTVTVGFDDTISFANVTGFDFDIVGLNVADVTLDILNVSEGGVVPAVGWDIFKATTTNGISGYEQISGSLLKAGNLVSLQAGTAFTLTNFYLSDANVMSGIYPFTFYVNSAPITGGISYTYSAQQSAVPVPAAMWLLGSGLLSLLGIRRKS